MIQFDTFKFHLLLQDKTIPELEAMIKTGETQFKVKRKGTYQLLETPTRDNSSGIYIDKNGRKWSVELV